MDDIERKQPTASQDDPAQAADDAIEAAIARDAHEHDRKATPDEAAAGMERFHSYFSPNDVDDVHRRLVTIQTAERESARATAAERELDEMRAEVIAAGRRAADEVNLRIAAERRAAEAEAALRASRANYDSLLAETANGARLARGDIEHAGARGVVSGIVLALSTLPPPVDTASIAYVLRAAGVSVQDMVDAGCLPADVEKFGPHAAPAGARTRAALLARPASVEAAVGDVLASVQRMAEGVADVAERDERSAPSDETRAACRGRASAARLIARSVEVHSALRSRPQPAATHLIAATHALTIHDDGVVTMVRIEPAATSSGEPGSGR